MSLVPLVLTGAFLSNCSEMEIGVEPVQRRLWRLTSIKSMTLSAAPLRNIGHLIPWPQLTETRLPSAKPPCNKEEYVTVVMQRVHVFPGQEVDHRPLPLKTNCDAKLMV